MAHYKGYIEHICTSNLAAQFQDEHISTYLRCIEEVKQSIDQSAVLSCYLTEVFNFEHRMYDGDSLEVVERSLTHNASREALVATLMQTHAIESEAYAQRSVQKLLNIHSASIKLVTEKRELTLDIDTVLHLHATLMRGLLPVAECGAFRKVNVKAKGYYWTTYARHEAIHSKLQVLLDVTNEQLSVHGTTASQVLVVASIFLVQFLHLHPFRNGNGRCARLLFSLIVQDFFPVPVSLHRHVGMSYDKSREKYLEALVTCQHGSAADYKAIVDYVFASVRSFLYDLYTIWAL